MLFIEDHGFQQRRKAVMDDDELFALSQSRFARLLGISMRTLHHWEQGTRTPTGAARVLLRLLVAGLS
ncbi:MAG: helix-turn-helix domain-containing protein [Verrucomicrobia bacterium]|nr:helix-turn-helix domain-containing protein [Verrucomicrobiota bacterium]